MKFDASAASRLRLSNGTPGGTITIDGQSPADANPQLGVIVYRAPVEDNWIRSVTSCLTKPASGSAVSSHLDVVTLDFSSQANVGGVA